MNFSLKTSECAGNNILLLTMLSLTVIAGSVTRIPFLRLALYLLVQYTSIYLTGLTIVERADVGFRTAQAKMFSAYAAGYAFWLAVYLLFLICNVPAWSVYFTAALTAVNLLYRLFGKREKRQAVPEAGRNQLRIVLAFYLLSAAVMFLCFQARLRSADLTGYVTMHFDDQFWFREAVEGTAGFPMPDFSAMGVYRYYHYFSGTWCSFLHYLTGIELFDICFSLSWVGDLFLFAGGVYVLFSESGIGSGIPLAAAFAALLFTSGAQKITSAYYINHLYVTHFGYLPGTAMGTYVFALFLKWYQSEKKPGLQLCLCLLMFAVTMGLKAPCGCIVLAGIGSLCLLVLAEGNRGNRTGERLSGLLAGAAFLILFLLVYRFFFVYPDDPIYRTHGSGERISLTSSLFKSGFFKPAVQKLTELLGNRYLAYVPAFAAYWVLSNFVLAAFVFAALIVFLKDRPELTQVNKAILILLVFGYGVYTLLYQQGYSNVYFMLAAFPYGMLLALDVLQRSKTFGSSNGLRRLLTAFLGFALLLGVFKTSLYYGPRYVLPGLKNLSAAYSEGHEYPGSSGNDVNKRELEGLRWLRENSPKDAVVATNLAVINHKAFTTSCYSERQAYIEGEAYGAASQELQDYRYGVTEQYFRGSGDAAKTLIAEGVDYAAVFSSVEGFTSYLGLVVFENEDIMIIKLSE